MRFISATSADGVVEQLFSLGELPGVLWVPEAAAGPRPLILMAHGGGQDKKAPGIAARARRFAAEGGFAVAAVDVPSHGDRPAHPEYQRTAAENQARVAARRRHCTPTPESTRTGCRHSGPTARCGSSPGTSAKPRSAARERAARSHSRAAG
jgi:pimeloyl-ACP methyl ester carboxylesterase